MREEGATMARPLKVVLREKDLLTPGDVHDVLRDELGFPDYYGCNLDALEDCLGDVRSPTRIVVKRDAEQPREWFDAFVEVIRDCAQRSCYLGCTIR